MLSRSFSVSPLFSVNGPTTPNLSRRTRFTGVNVVPVGGDAMSKIPELKTLVVPDGHVGGIVEVSHPASTSRCVSNAGSLGLLDPNSAPAGNVATPIARDTVSVAKNLRMTLLSQRRFRARRRLPETFSRRFASARRLPGGRDEKCSALGYGPALASRCAPRFDCADGRAAQMRPFRRGRPRAATNWRVPAPPAPVVRRI